MTQTKHLTFVAAVLLLLSILFITLSGPSKSLGSAPGGLPTSVATSSALTLSATTATTILATSTCDARIITTKASPILLTFSDYAGQAPSATFGHLQAASTTAVYDSGQYGCGLVKAYAMTADVISVTETR